jgi:nicotinate phosphoribosyltransferase
MINGTGNFFGADVITRQDEREQEIMHHPFETEKSLILKDFKQEAMLRKVMENGAIIEELPDLQKTAIYHQQQFKRLPEEYKRFDNPHIYKVGISEKMRDERNRLKSQYRK